MDWGLHPQRFSLSVLEAGSTGSAGLAVIVRLFPAFPTASGDLSGSCGVPRPVGASPISLFIFLYACSKCLARVTFITFISTLFEEWPSLFLFCREETYVLFITQFLFSPKFHLEHSHPE